MWYGRRQNRYLLVALEHVVRTQTKQVFTGNIGTCDTDADKIGIHWWHRHMWYERRQNRYSLVTLEHVIRTQTKQVFIDDIGSPYHMFQCHQWIPVLSAFVSHVPMSSINTCFVCVRITCSNFTSKYLFCLRSYRMFQFQQWIPVLSAMWYGRRQNRYSLLKLKHVIRTQTKQVFTGEIGTCDTDADKKDIYWWHLNMWYGRRQNRYLLVKLEHVIRTQTKQVFTGNIGTCDTDADKKDIYWWHLNMWYERRQNRYLLVKLEHVIRTQTKQVFIDDIGSPYHMFQFHQ